MVIWIRLGNLCLFSTDEPNSIFKTHIHFDGHNMYKCLEKTLKGTKMISGFIHDVELKVKDFVPE
jgi:hypothetical protein